MEQRFSRTELLIGKEGISKLSSSSVLIFGLGGVGSYAAEALARSGVGRLALVDGDTVSVSNINRQLHAMDDTVGMPKAGLMEDRIRRINPGVRVTGHVMRYTPGNREYFFADRPDYVVDAIDDTEGKVDLIKYCHSSGIPVVSSMGAGNKLDPTLFRVGDISGTSVCPLARVVRRRLRQEGIISGVKVVYSVEAPVVRKGGEAPGENATASISFVPPVAGMILAGVVVRDLLGILPGT